MLNNKDVIEVKDGVIPYDKINDQKDITFVIITKDDTVLEKTIKSIADFYNEHKDTNITVVISSDYEKLHEVTEGKL